MLTRDLFAVAKLLVHTVTISTHESRQLHFSAMPYLQSPSSRSAVCPLSSTLLLVQYVYVFHSR